MSSTEITVRIDANAEDYRRVLWWYQRTRTVITAILTFLVLLGIGFYVSRITGYGGVRLEFVIGLLSIPFIAFGALFLGVWRQAKKIAEISVPASITFSSTGISSVSESSETDVQWKRFNKIIETEQDFIVFPQENVFYPVPKRFFEDALQIVSLRTLIMEHLGERSRLKI